MENDSRARRTKEVVCKEILPHVLIVGLCNGSTFQTRKEQQSGGQP
jgi:hypothetical protein